MPQLNILSATTKTQHSQINKYFKNKFKSKQNLENALIVLGHSAGSFTLPKPLTTAHVWSDKSLLAPLQKTQKNREEAHMSPFCCTSAVFLSKVG